VRRDANTLICGRPDFVFPPQPLTIAMLLLLTALPDYEAPQFQVYFRLQDWSFHGTSEVDGQPSAVLPYNKRRR
jgi:hypothetical protein